MATEHSTTTITGGHANAVASGAAGFMSGADKAKLDGIAAGANVTGANPPQAHASTHAPGGSDEVNALAAGSNLTDADQTIQWSTTDTYRRMPATTTTVTRAKTLGTTNAVAGSTWVLDFYSQGNDVTIVNGGSGAGTIDTITAGTKVRYVARYDGVNWTKGVRLPLA